VTLASWLLISICILTGFSLFFSLNAISLRIFSQVKLHEAFKKLDKQEAADRLIAKSEQLVLSCSLYRFVLSEAILILLVGLFSVTAEGETGVGVYVWSLVLTAIIYSVFMLAIPHAWAKYAGEKVLSRTHRLLLFFSFPVWPGIYTFTVYDGLIRRLAGVVETTPQKRQEEKQEEFINGLEQRRMEGVMDIEEQEMIENVLELSDTTVNEIVTPRTDVMAIDVNSSRDEVLDTVIKAGHSRIPVYEENVDNVIGLIYAKDLLTEIGKETEHFDLRGQLRKAYFVPQTKPLRILLHEFQNQKLHIAIVLDEYGGMAGIVTLEDILEELVGEITDEYESTPPEHITRIDQRTIEVDARTYIDELNDRFDLDLPEEEDYDTIGGFVFSHLGYIPETGRNFVYENLKFTISAAEERKIKRVTIEKIGQ